MTKAKVQSLLKEINERNRTLNKIAIEVEKLEKKAKAEEKAIKAKDKFKGWLPKGDYTLGAAKFTVKATQKRQKFKGK